MRLGAYTCNISDGTLAHKAYKAKEISERHRHRYEFNNKYKDVFVENGMTVSGVSPSGELVEIMELNGHPWFLGCQFHPEFKSRPMDPQPLFREFIAASLSYKNKKK
jgi:CTP synthase